MRRARQRCDYLDRPQLRHLFHTQSVPGQTEARGTLAAHDTHAMDERRLRGKQGKENENMNRKIKTKTRGGKRARKQRKGKEGERTKRGGSGPLLTATPRAAMQGLLGRGHRRRSLVGRLRSERQHTLVGGRRLERHGSDAGRLVQLRHAARRGGLDLGLGLGCGLQHPRAEDARDLLVSGDDPREGQRSSGGQPVVSCIRAEALAAPVRASPTRTRTFSLSSSSSDA